jgi:hypothetical protein
MTSDRLAQAVREQVAIGRVLPLGGPADAAWITEQAAARVLRTAAAGVPGVRLGTLRVGLEPLAVEAAFETSADRPLPVTADLLRSALWQAAHDRLGLLVAAIDLTVTGLLDKAPAPPPPAPAPPPTDPGPQPVPGLARLTSRLGGAGADAYLQIAVAAGHRALDVARAARQMAAPRAVLVTDVD